MAKRRTRKQKQTASTRHDYTGQLTITTGSTPTRVTINIPQETSRHTIPSANAGTISHSYVVRDIKNTLSISAILVLLDIILFFILRFRLLSIPGVGF